MALAQSGSACTGGIHQVSISTVVPDSVRWSIPGYADTTTTTATLSFENRQPGLSTVGLRIYGGGCTPHKDTIAQYAVAVPSDVSIAYAPAGSCANDTTVFSSDYAGTGTYQWRFYDGAALLQSGSGAVTNFSRPSLYGDGTRTITAQLQINENNTCLTGDTVQFSIKEVPDPSFQDFSDNPYTNCDLSSYTLSIDNMSATAGTNAEYRIDWGDGQSEVLSDYVTLTHTYSTLGSFNLVILVKGNNGCEAQENQAVFNGGNPNYGCSSEETTINLCAEKLVTFRIVNFENNVAGTTYTITGNDGLPDTTFSHPPPSSFTRLYTKTSCGYTTSSGTPNSFYLKINAQNPCGEKSFLIEPITLSEKPHADFTVPDTIFCLNTAVPFQDISIGGYNVASSCARTTKRNWLISPATGWTASGALGNNPPSNNPATWGAQNLVITFNQPGTYEVRLISGNVCGNDTAVKTICIQDPALVPDFALPNDTVCAGSSFTVFNQTELNGAFCSPPAYAWSVSQTASSSCASHSGQHLSFLGGTNAGSSQPEVQLSNSGHYSFSCTLTDVCGQRTTSKPLVVKDKIQLDLPQPGPFCDSAAFQPLLTADNCFSGGIAAITWTFPGGSPASSSQVSPGTVKFSAIGSHSIKVLVSNECGTSQDSTQFTIAPSPTPDAGNDTAICTGSALVLGSAPVAGYTYLWTPSAGLNDPNSARPLLSANNTGSGPVVTYYKVAVSVADCIVEDSIAVTVYPLPAAPVLPDTATCAGEEVVLTWSGPGVVSWYTVASGGVPFFTGNSLNITPQSTTQLFAELTSAEGCRQPSRDQITVTVHALPVVTAFADTTICNQPIAVQLTGSPSGGSWTGTNVTPGGSFTPSGNGNTDLVYQYTDPLTGCSDIDHKIITVVAPVAAMAGPDTALCAGTAMVQFTALPMSGGAWINTSKLQSSGAFLPDSAGDYNLVYTYGSGNCLTSDSMAVTVHPLPVVIAGADLELCLNESDTLLTDPTPAGGAWSGNGIDAGGRFSPAIGGTGSHAVVYQFTDSRGCINTDSRIITIHPLPIFSLFPQDTVICNQAIEVALQVEPAGGTWFGQGISPDGYFLPAGTGDSLVFYTVSNSFGCQDTLSTTLHIVEPVFPDAGPDTTVCALTAAFVLQPQPVGGAWQTTGMLAADGTFDPLSSGLYTAVYELGQGNCLTRDTLDIQVLELPAVDAGTGFTRCINEGDTLVVAIEPTGGYWSGPAVTPGGLFDPAGAGSGDNILIYSFTDDQGCVNSDSIIATVHALPVLNLFSADTSICDQPVAVQLAASPAGGTWLGPIAADGTFMPVSAGDFPVSYAYTDAFGCSDTSGKIVHVLETIHSNAGNDTSACEGGAPLQLSGMPPGGQWESAPMLTSSGQFTPLTPGAWELVYSYGSGNCLTHDTAIGFVNDLPGADAGPDFSLCEDRPDTLLTAVLPTGGGTWSGTDIDAGGYFTPSAGPGVYTVTFYFTDANNCTSSDNRVITLNPLPQVMAFADTTVCSQPVAVQFTGFPAGGTWDGSPEVSPGGSFVPQNTGAVTLRYSYQDPSTGCKNSDDKQVDKVMPLQAVAGNDTAFCLGATTVQMQPGNSGGTWEQGTKLNNAGFFLPDSIGIYQLVYTQGTGNCRTTDTARVEVRGLPSVSAGPDIAFCLNSKDSLLKDASPAGGTWAGTGISPAGLFMPAAGGTGSHQLTYTYADAFGCSNTGDRVITVNPLPVIDVFNPDTVVCNQPIPVQLVAVPAGGSWSGSGVAANGIFTPSATGTFAVFYSAGNGFGCRDTVQKNIRVDEPSPISAGTDTAVCEDVGAIQLSGLPGGGSWISMPGLSQTGFFSPPSPDLYQAVYTLGSGNCLVRDSVLVLVHPLPDVNAGGDVQLCLNSSDTLLLPVIPASGGTWSGTAIIAGGIFSPASAGAGIFTVSYNYTDANGCTKTDDLEVTVSDLPDIDVFAADTTLCNQPIPFDFDAIPGGGIWEGQHIDAGGTFLPAGTGDFPVRYIAVNSAGCTDTGYKMIHVLQPVIPDAGADLYTCIGGNPRLLSASPAGGTWQSNAQLTAIGWFTPQTAGAFNFVYNYGTGNCLTHDTVLVTINDVIPVDAGGDFTLCENFGDTLLDPVDPPGGTWSGNGINAVGLFNTFLAGPSVSALQYTYTDGNGCTNSDSRTITVRPVPQVDVGSPDTTVCNLPVLVRFDGGPAGGFWYGPGVNTSGVFTPFGTGDVMLYYTAGNVFGCRDTAEKLIHVINPVVPDAGQDVSMCQSSNPVVLVGLPIGGVWTATPYLDAGGAFAPSSPGLYAAVYSYGTGNCRASDTTIATVYQQPVADFAFPVISSCSETVTLQPTNLSTGSTQYEWIMGGMHYFGFQPSIDFYGPGQRVIELIATNQLVCFDTISKTIEILPAMQADFQCGPVVCPGEPFTPQNLTIGAKAFQWFINDSLVSDLKDPLFTLNVPGDYKIQLLARTDSCLDSLEVPVYIEVEKLPVPGFRIPETVDIEDQAFQILCDAYGYDSVRYTSGSEILGWECNTTAITNYAVPGVYPVYQHLISPSGCRLSFVKMIEVVADKGIYVPNAFTPDGDGRNDDFSFSIFGYRSFELYILDRWGRDVFYSTSLDHRWNGAYFNAGEILKTDVYNWKVITVDIYGNREVHMGKVSLVR